MSSVTKIMGACIVSAALLADETNAIQVQGKNGKKTILKNLRVDKRANRSVASDKSDRFDQKRPTKNIASNSKQIHKPPKFQPIKRGNNSEKQESASSDDGNKNLSHTALSLCGTQSDNVEDPDNISSDGELNVLCDYGEFPDLEEQKLPKSNLNDDSMHEYSDQLLKDDVLPNVQMIQQEIQPKIQPMNGMTQVQNFKSQESPNALLDTAVILDNTVMLDNTSDDIEAIAQRVEKMQLSEGQENDAAGSTNPTNVIGGK